MEGCKKPVSDVLHQVRPHGSSAHHIWANLGSKLNTQVRLTSVAGNMKLVASGEVQLLQGLLSAVASSLHAVYFTVLAQRPTAHEAMKIF